MYIYLDLYYVVLLCCVSIKARFNAAKIGCHQMWEQLIAFVAFRKWSFINSNAHVVLFMWGERRAVYLNAWKNINTMRNGPFAAPSRSANSDQDIRCVQSATSWIESDKSTGVRDHWSNRFMCSQGQDWSWSKNDDFTNDLFINLGHRVSRDNTHRISSYSAASTSRLVDQITK